MLSLTQYLKIFIYVLIVVLLILLSLFIVNICRSNEKYNEKYNEKTVALGFWGLTRSLSHTVNSINNKVLNVLKKYNIKPVIFMHTYEVTNIYSNKRTGEKNIKMNNDEYKLLNYDFIHIDNQEQIKKSLNLKQYRSYPDPWNTNYGSVDNFILALYSKSKLTKMIEESNIDFDYVIFLRPDVEYISDFNVSFFDKVNNNTICIPDFHKHPINDRFAICNKYNYKIYGDMFDQLLEYSKKQKLHSETIIKQILNKNKINTINIPFYFRRVRANGSKVDGSILHLLVNKIKNISSELYL